MGWPSRTARPLVGRITPNKIFKSVVFPAPLGPNKPKISPLLTLNEIFLFAIFGGIPLTPGYTFLRSLATNGYYPY